ncbi:YicC family protein [Bacillus sp. APMAM]|nr:YicC family protein [Bacillus sp. APMAM]RTZ57920.1 YicC family protein [Bacillus sp. SAJ1]
MVLSMTGFGRSKKQQQGFEAIVEIKTVNHRFSEINVRVPRTLLKIEEKVKKTINEYIHRGRIEVFILLSGNGGTTRKLHIDWNLLDDYYQFISQLKNKYDLHSLVDLKDLLTQHDIVSIEELEEENKDLEELVLLAVKEAIHNVVQMRTVEGEQLHKDIVHQLGLFQKCLEMLTEYAPAVVEQYKMRIEKKIKDYTAGHFDESRVLTEIAIFVDKADINEEITRLESHLLQFKNSLLLDGPVGRKLDFMIQEMNREVNTIGSKANDSKISSLIVEMKTILEKMREQVQNIE